ncbi:MAG TPA: hypothetical protein DDZ40_13910 [Deltaproteobacteria bacterium]|nr:hypothetical protein [Deltaproteobacteria bacterium]
MNKIDRMNRFRKNLLRGFLWGFGLWTALQVIWTGIAFNRLIPQASPIFAIISRFIQFGVYASILVTLFFFLRFWRYKRSLRKDPEVRAALDDERVRLSWFKAYRFAFLTVVVVYIILFLNEAFPQIAFHKHGLILPQETQTQLTLLVAVLSCVGAFLHYSREE